MSERKTCRSLILVWIVIAGMAPIRVQAEPSLDDLAAARAAAEKARHEAELKPLLEAKIRCGPWHAVGPFKDAEYGVFGREFETVFDPEKDVIARGDQLAELDKMYQSFPVIGAPDGSRRWAAHPDWADGYYNQLPSGPPPGRNEVMYLYRTITCSSPAEVTAWLVTLDAAKAWLDGKPILNAPIRGGAGQRFLQASFKIPLQAGQNRLLVKIAKCFQKNGFSFAIDGLHPIHPMLKGQPLAHDAGCFGPAYEPYASALWQGALVAKDSDPAWYVKRPTWQETLLASRQAAAAAAKQRSPGDLPYQSAVLRQKDEWFDTWFGLDAAAVVSGTAEFILADSVESVRAAEATQDAGARLRSALARDFPTRQERHEIHRELADGIWNGVDSASQAAALGERYAQVIVRTMGLSKESALSLPRGLESLRPLYHQVKQFDESLRKLRSVRFDVESMPTFDPPALAMQQALEKLEPTPGGAAYLARLAPVRRQARAALADYEAGRSGSAQAVIRAAQALDRFREESIGAVGPIVFVRHPSFGVTNAVSPYSTGGRRPASIAVFDPARPDQPPRVIYDDRKGWVWQASLSYDARTVLFAAHRQGVSGGWHIYEIGVDGRGL